jgi:hypothetical protein
MVTSNLSLRMAAETVYRALEVYPVYPTVMQLIAQEDFIFLYKTCENLKEDLH